MITATELIEDIGLDEYTELILNEMIDFIAIENSELLIEIKK